MTESTLQSKYLELAKKIYISQHSAASFRTHRWNFTPLCPEYTTCKIRQVSPFALVGLKKKWVRATVRANDDIRRNHTSLHRTNVNQKAIVLNWRCLKGCCKIFGDKFGSFFLGMQARRVLYIITWKEDSYGNSNLRIWRLSKLR